MRLPFWLRRPRQTEFPVRDVTEAVLGNLAVLTLLALGIGAVADGGRAGLAAGSGAGVVLAANLVTWLVALGAGRLGAQAAVVLLLGYALKVLAGLMLVAAVPVPGDWPRGWIVAGAVAGVVVMMLTEIWAVRRLRITYFAPTDAGPVTRCDETRN